MKKFDWEAFKNTKFAVHTKTQEEYNSFMLECEKQGLTWGKRDVPTSKNLWDKYGDKTCIIVDTAMFADYKHLWFVDIPCYEEADIKILEFTDFEFEKAQEDAQATEKTAEETPNKKPLDFEFAKKLSELQGKFTTELFELSKEYDISEADLLKKAISGFEFVAFLKKVVGK